MKAIEQYFHAALFIILYKVILTFKSVDKTLVCDHSKESYWAVISCGTVGYTEQNSPNQMCDLFLIIKGYIHDQYENVISFVFHNRLFTIPF